MLRDCSGINLWLLCPWLFLVRLRRFDGSFLAVACLYRFCTLSGSPLCRSAQARPSLLAPPSCWSTPGSSALRGPIVTVMALVSRLMETFSVSPARRRAPHQP